MDPCSAFFNAVEEAYAADSPYLRSHYAIGVRQLTPEEARALAKRPVEGEPGTCAQCGKVKPLSRGHKKCWSCRNARAKQFATEGPPLCCICRERTVHSKRSPYCEECRPKSSWQYTKLGPARERATAIWGDAV